MSHLRNKANECNYQQDDRKCKEKNINGINNNVLTSEIIKELTAIKNTRKVTSEQVLAGAGRTEAQKSQKATLTSIQENRKSAFIKNLRHNSS